MNRTNGPLLLILLIQCAITAAVYWPQQTNRQDMVQQTLLPIEPGAIEELRISDNASREALLVKIGQRWLLPGLSDLPADPELVEKLLTALASAEDAWPVARSVAARQRFQVADYAYQRHLSLTTAGQVQNSIYLGTAPGFRKVHARNTATDAIYSIAFNVHDAPAENGAWIDRKLLQIRTPVRISADAYSVHRQGSGWQAGNGKTPDEREMQALLGALRALQVDGVAQAELQEALAQAEPELVLTIESLAGNLELRLFSNEREHFIHSSEYPYYFKLSSYDYDRLTGIDFVLISGDAAPSPLEETDPLEQ